MLVLVLELVLVEVLELVLLLVDVLVDVGDSVIEGDSVSDGDGERRRCSGASASTTASANGPFVEQNTSPPALQRLGT